MGSTLGLAGHALGMNLLTSLDLGETDGQVTTLEGLGDAKRLHALQRAFIEEQAAQCGYCIPGMMMRAHALLQKNPGASDNELRTHMQPNLCRCGTHMRILRAVRRAAQGMRSAAAATLQQEAAR